MKQQINDRVLCAHKDEKPSDINGNIVPSFDLMKYLAMAEEFDMSDEEKTELLKILWDIMSRFVELGFRVDSTSLSQKAHEEALENSVKSLVSLDQEKYHQSKE